ncbi:MAG: hypothetical protein Fues2KO_27590 [Fuerstiella sp.]
MKVTEAIVTPITSTDESRTVSSDDAAMKARWRPLLFALLIVALVLRLIAANVVERHVQNAGRSFLIEGDANGYWELGRKIAAGEDYSLHQPPRRILRTPGFPLWLAGSIRLFGVDIAAARYGLAVLGTFACWLTFELGRRVHMTRTGFWAALYVAVHPLQIVTSVMILSETLFSVCMLASLLALHRLLEHVAARNRESNSDSDANQTSVPPWQLAIATGVLIGLTILVRPGFVPWLLVAALALLLCLRQAASPRWIPAAVVVLACVVTLSPWAVRNYQVSGRWVLTSLWSGPSLYDGLNPTADGTSNMQFFDDENVMGRQQMSEYDMNRHYRDRAIRFAMENPATATKLAFRKAALFLNPVPGSLQQSNWAVRAICVLFWAWLFLFAVAGSWSRQWEWQDLLVLVGPFLLFLLIHMVFVGSVRYRLPVEFPLAVLAAIGWRHCVLNLKNRAKDDPVRVDR